MGYIFKPNSIIDEVSATTKRKKLFGIGLTFLLIYYISSLISGFMLAPPMYYLAFTDDRFINYITESISAAEAGNITNELTEGAEKILLEILADNAPFINMCSLFATVATIGVVLIYCIRFEKRRPFSMGFVREGFFSEYISGFGIGILMFAVAYGIVILTGEAKFVEFNLNIDYVTIALFLMGFLIQGASEEILLRSYFFVTTAANTNVLLAIISSSALFGALHIANGGFTLLAFFNLFLFGVFAAFYFLRRGSIWGICALHSAWNFVQGNVFGCNVSGMSLENSFIITETKNGLWSGGSFGPEGGLAVTVVFLIGIAILTLMPNKNTNEFFSRKGEFRSEPI